MIFYYGCTPIFRKLRFLGYVCPNLRITVPAYAYIGDADIVAEGEAVTIEKMTTSTRKATVKKAMKGIGLTDEAVLSGYGNPVGTAKVPNIR